ncbi:Nucleoside phosphatase GDA1/CD39 [Dillenia turbinata]|uniref:Nucleoside phosphatase GDA1/CD39 n=1 Tax=Dillenia turbinata TaxID=194707 RepID=A0AAN8VF32_9MAGN
MDYSYSRLQSWASSAYIPPHRTQLHPRMHSFPSPYNFQINPSKPQSQNSKDKLLIIFVFLLLFPFLIYLFTTAKDIHNSSKFGDSRPKGFGIIIHAGVSSSRIHIFEYLNEGRVPFIGFNGNGNGSNSFKARLGLLGFRDKPEKAGDLISGFLEYARKRVPKTEWKETKIQLLFSGEMEKVGVDSELKEEMLESCRRVLRSSGFLFKDQWAEVMKGEDQGVYSWIAINYVLGTLGREPQDTMGVVELGGASLQVVFAPTASPPIQFSRTIKLAGVIYSLYTRSLPQFGQDATWESLLELKLPAASSTEGTLSNPCIPRGYELTPNASNSKILAHWAVGNFSACRSEVSALLKRRNDKCSHPPCEMSSSFLELQGNSIPPKRFFYTSELLLLFPLPPPLQLFGLLPRTSLSELEVAGQHYCQDDWDRLKMRHRGADILDLSRYCFSSAYIMALLHDSFGISIYDKRIGFAQHGNGGAVDWTLGAFVLQTMLFEPLELEPDNSDHVVGNDMVTFFTLFAILLMVVVAALFVVKWRRPQLRTIYDLEKGHYIVTRVPR